MRESTVYLGKNRIKEQKRVLLFFFLLGNANMTERKAKVKLIQEGTWRLLSNGYRHFALAAGRRIRGVPCRVHDAIYGRLVSPVKGDALVAAVETVL